MRHVIRRIQPKICLRWPEYCSAFLEFDFFFQISGISLSPPSKFSLLSNVFLSPRHPSLGVRPNFPDDQTPTSPKSPNATDLAPTSQISPRRTPPPSVNSRALLCPFPLFLPSTRDFALFSPSLSTLDREATLARDLTVDVAPLSVEFLSKKSEVASVFVRSVSFSPRSSMLVECV
ncbi:Protein kinase domain-containing protein [Psidium guajava]|nr:Protein kinase domain-containing protein [Psidium guajava]